MSVSGTNRSATSRSLSAGSPVLMFFFIGTFTANQQDRETVRSGNNSYSASRAHASISLKPDKFDHFLGVE